MTITKESKKRRILRFYLLSFLCTMASLAQPKQLFAEFDRFELVNGKLLKPCRIGYRIWGNALPDGSNVVVIPTWFVGTSGDMSILIGENSLMDTTRFSIIAIDALGNGISSSPSNVEDHKRFPEITIRDMVNTQYRLLNEVLGFEAIYAVVGESMGGMQAFEWALAYPNFVQRIVSITGSPRPTSYDIGLWETEILILPNFINCDYKEAAEAFAGISLLALTTMTFQNRETHRDSVTIFIKKFAKEIALTAASAHDIISQLRAMISHDISHAFDHDMFAAAASITTPVLVIVSESDRMVIPAPAIEFARLLNSEPIILKNDCGHMVQWCDWGNVTSAVRKFLLNQQ